MNIAKVAVGAGFGGLATGAIVGQLFTDDKPSPVSLSAHRIAKTAVWTGLGAAVGGGLGFAGTIGSLTNATQKQALHIGGRGAVVGAALLGAALLGGTIVDDQHY